MQRTITIGIDGMTCQGCVGSVQRALERVPGVLETTVSLASGEAEVSFEDSQTSRAALAQAISDAGFDPRP